MLGWGLFLARSAFRRKDGGWKTMLLLFRQSLGNVFYTLESSQLGGVRLYSEVGHANYSLPNGVLASRSPHI